MATYGTGWGKVKAISYDEVRSLYRGSDIKQSHERSALLGLIFSTRVGYYLDI